MVSAIPPAARAHFDAALAHHRAGRLAAALAGYDAAIAVSGDYVDAHGNRAVVLVAQGDGEGALAAFDRAVAINPNWVDGQVNRAMLLVQQGRYDAAIAGYALALALDPRHVVAAVNKALALARAHRHAEAIAAFDAALQLAPDAAALHCGRGLSLWSREDITGAAAAFDRALALDPRHVEAWFRKGELLAVQGDHGGAGACFDRALAIDPGRVDIRERRVDTDRALARWDRLDGDLALLVAAIDSGQPIATPFPLFAASDDPALLTRAAALHVEKMRGWAPAVAAPLPVAADKLRIAYVSADFHGHATMFLFAEALEAHDRAGFELTLFSMGPRTGDAWQHRARAAADRFVDIGDMPDAGVTALARQLGIDIAVDLKGFTNMARPGIFAARAAPVQVNFLGYPGSMAADYIDYLVADRVLVPDALRPHYPEALVRLPGCYQPNGAAPPPGPPPPRGPLGLPDGAMVFASFNQLWKLTPAQFAAWMAILRGVPGSVLWLWAAAPARANLRAAAAAHGVAAERLVFAEGLPRAAHLDRIGAADLMLDCFPCGAHTTGSDALRMGVPLLTIAGRSFASRVAASLVTAVGLAELVTENTGDYVALATALGNDRPALAAVRARLAAALATAPLFDAGGFARHLEAAYRAMAARARAGLPPADIDIEVNPSPGCG